MTSEIGIAILIDQLSLKARFLSDSQAYISLLSSLWVIFSFFKLSKQD